MTLSTSMESGYDQEVIVYRAVSKSAVTSLLVGILSLAAIAFVQLLFLPVIGILFGVVAVRGIAKYPDELTGRNTARIGITLCLLLLLGGGTAHAYWYLTEVPEGFERVPFYVLKAHAEGPEVPPPEALELDGKSVFIKGYIYPSDQKRKLKEFVLVPDLGTCCFGGQPKLTHMIHVTLKGDLTMDYSMRKRRFAGQLRVDNQLKPLSGIGGVYYQLIAEHAN